MKRDLEQELPPLPLEEELFLPVTAKEKTNENIMLVGEKLLLMVLKENVVVVEVDKMAEELQTDKRQVLVICNVLEGLRLMDKQSSNVWHWRGMKMLQPTMIMLKQMAERQNMMEQVEMIGKLQTNDDTMKAPTDPDKKRENTKYNIVMITQKLMMIFLIIPNPKVIFLPEISAILHGPCLTHMRRKTSVQKLEEVCDVLQCLELVTRVVVKKEDNKETIAYQYEGQDTPLVAILDEVSETRDIVEELNNVRSRTIINENYTQVEVITEEGLGIENDTTSNEQNDGEATKKLLMCARGKRKQCREKGDSLV